MQGLNKSKFFNGNTFDSAAYAKYYLSENKMIYVDGVGFYGYGDSWKLIADHDILTDIYKSLGKEVKTRRVDDVAKMLKYEATIPMKEFEKGQNKNRFVLKNGTLDISDWKNHIFYFGKFFEEDFSTVQLDIEYDDKADCPLFKKFLNEIFEGEVDTIKAVQEMMGYCLTTSTKFEKAFLLYGTGSNGKSVLINVIHDLLSDANITTLSISEIEKQFNRPKLMDKLVNISSEFEDAIFKSENLKKVISGELIDACFKFKTPFDFKPYCKLITSTNNIPRINDKSHGLYRRLLTIPFNKTFSDGEQDRYLIDKLRTERAGILMFALAGLARLAEHDAFTESESMNRLKLTIQYENNNVLQFIDECAILDVTLSISVGNLYYAYSTYCNRMGYRPMNCSNFGKEIARHGVTKSRKRNEEGAFISHYNGICLK